MGFLALLRGRAPQNAISRGFMWEGWEAVPRDAYFLGPSSLLFQRRRRYPTGADCLPWTLLPLPARELPVPGSGPAAFPTASSRSRDLACLGR